MESDNQTSEAKYPLTGNSSRDSVRKMLYEVFQGDPELGPFLPILEECKDPKSKQYRDKCRAGPRFEASRRDFRAQVLDAKTLISDEFVQGKSTSAPTGDQINSQRPPNGPHGAQGMMPRPNIGMQGPGMGFRPTGPQGMRPRMMMGGQPPGFRPPMGGIRQNIPTYIPTQQTPIIEQQPEGNISERNLKEQAQQQTQNQIETNTNQNVIQKQQSEDRHQFSAVQNNKHEPLQESKQQQMIQRDSSQSLNQSIQSIERQQQNNEYVERSNEKQAQNVQQNQLNNDNSQINQDSQKMQQNENIRVLDQSVDISESRESAANAAKKKKKKKKKAAGTTKGVEQTIDQKSPEQEQTQVSQQVSQSNNDNNEDEGERRIQAQIESNLSMIDNVSLRQQPIDQQQQQTLIQERIVEQQKQNQENNLDDTQYESSKLGSNYQFLDQSSSVIIEDREETFLSVNQRSNNLQDYSQLQDQSKINESVNILSNLNINEQEEIKEEQKVIEELAVSKKSSRPISKRESQNKIIELDNQVSGEESVQSSKIFQKLEQEQSEIGQDQISHQAPKTHNKTLSIKSQAQSSQQQQNNEPDRDNIKRLQDALSYKRSQKKDLAEKLIHLENDCHLQQRKANMLMEENKQLRDDLKDKDRKLKQLKVKEQEQEALVTAQARGYESQINERQLEINQLKKENLRHKEEKHQYRDKLQQLMDETQAQRQFLDNLMKSIEQRVNNTQFSQQIISQNVNSGDSGSNQSEQVEQLQREIRDQKQHYEQKIRDLNEELNNRTRMFQRTERQNIQLQEKNNQLNELLSQVEIQQLSTVAGSGSNQRDSSAIFNRRQQPSHLADNNESDIPRAYEEEGTGGDGGYNQSNLHQIRNQNDFLISDEGGNIAAVNGGSMDQYEDESNHNNDDIISQPRNQRQHQQQQNYQLEAVGGGHTQFEEEGDQEDDIDEDDDYEDDEHLNGGEDDEEDEEGNQFDDNTQGIAQQFSQSNNRDNQILGQQHQQLNPTNFNDETEGYAGGQQTYGQSRQRKQGQRRRGNRQQNQQNTSASNSIFQNPRQRNSRGRQRSNQQHIQQQQQVIQQQNPLAESLNAPPSSQVAQSQLRQNQLSQAPPSDFFQNYGDSSTLFMHNQNRDQSAPFHQTHHSAVNQREGGVAGQGVVLTAGRSNLPQQTAESMMSAESGSTATAYFDKNQFHRGHNAPLVRQHNQPSSLQSVQQNAQQQIQTGSNNQTHQLTNIQQVPSDLFSDTDNYTAAVGAPTSRAAAHPRQQRQQVSNQQNLYGGYQFQEEVKQSSGEIPIYYQMNSNQQQLQQQTAYGSIRINNHPHNQFVGGSGEQEEDSSSGFFVGGPSIIQPQMQTMSQQYHSHGSAGGPGSAFESSKRNQSSVQQIRPNLIHQQQQDQSNTPTRNVIQSH
ncbi:UNKNOWN [Stylonychia lemnae]|uniref:Uncharacterized protein n=1 Tax=Stylonychia lemnae TaxID=5949 RepID=A0A078A645_STYLE|nr:UNKNOWN [Stylonychia lemnae]|eukprot:CDW77669.1 UNKNOWN [Stylonychia lemnae]